MPLGHPLCIKGLETVKAIRVRVEVRQGGWSRVAVARTHLNIKGTGIPGVVVECCGHQPLWPIPGRGGQPHQIWHPPSRSGHGECGAHSASRIDEFHTISSTIPMTVVLASRVVASVYRSEPPLKPPHVGFTLFMILFFCRINTAKICMYSYRI